MKRRAFVINKRNQSARFGAGKTPACSEARIFLCVALIAGLLLTWMIPPLCAPDEVVHFENIWAVSRGQLFALPHEGTSVRWVSSDYDAFLKKYPGRFWRTDDEATPYSYGEMIGASRDDRITGEKTPYDTHIVSLGYTASALSMAIGTAVGRVLGFSYAHSAYNQMLLGRMGNVLFYALVIYFAIRKAPHFRRVILLLGCMPMSLFLAASLNYDAMLIPAVLYYLALILSLCERPDTPITRGDTVRLLLCALFLTGIKAANAVFLLLLFFVPRGKWGLGKRRIMLWGVIAAAALAGLLPALVQSILNPAVSAEAKAADPSRLQTKWLLSHLTGLPRLLGVTWLARRGSYIEGFWGTLGWLDTYIPLPLILSGYAVIAAEAIYEGCTFPFFKGRRRKNLLPLAVSLVYILGTFITLYIIHTPLPDVTGEIGGPCIEGVQGRYFIPVFLPLLMAVSNGLLLSRDTAAMRRRMTLLAGICCACCGALTVGTVLARYWI